MDINTILISLISVVIGGVIAMTGTLLASRIKARADRRQELMRLAIMAGVEAFKSDREKHLNTELRNYPMSFYIFFHYSFLHLVEEGRATPDEVRKLNDKQRELFEAVKEGAWGRAIITPHTSEEVKTKL